MRILNAYITRDYIVVFLVSLTIFLFVMAVGNIFRVIDLISRGVSGMLILKIFSYGIPFSLIFAIPMSILAASFLMFSRITDDGEVTAMKACGISIWQVVQPPVLVASVLCVVCVYINFTLAPASHYARRNVVEKLFGIENPIELLDEGRFVRDFPGLAIYVGRKYGNRISDIVIHQFGERGLKQTIRARSGVVETDDFERGRIVVRLRNVHIEQADEKHPEDLTRMRHVTVEEYPMPIDMRFTQERTVWKKRADFTMREVFSGIRGEPIFMCGDLIDLERIAHRLRAPRDVMGAYVRGFLSKKTRSLVDEYEGQRALRAQLDNALMEEFNKLIRRKNLYNETVFERARVQLAEETEALLGRPISGVMLTHLNRRLLEDAFPSEIARNPIMDLSPKEAEVHRMSMKVEASTRLALSLCTIAFALLGCALGIKIRRKESSVGVAVTLTMIFFFYFFIIIADSLVNRPEFQPHLIVWFPFLIAEGVGYHLLRRAS